MPNFNPHNKIPNINIPLPSDNSLKRKPTSSPTTSPVVQESMEEVAQTFAKKGATKTKRMKAQIPKEEATLGKLKQVSGSILSPKKEGVKALKPKKPSARMLALQKAEKEFVARTKGKILEPKGGSDVGGGFIASDVLFYSSGKGMSLVIKPGQKEIAEGLSAQAVLDIVGLSDTVPVMKAGVIDQVKSSQDLNVKYQRLQNDSGRQYLVEKRWSIPIEKQEISDETIVYHKESGVHLSISEQGNKFYVEVADAADNPQNLEEEGQISDQEDEENGRRGDWRSAFDFGGPNIDFAAQLRGDEEDEVENEDDESVDSIDDGGWDEFNNVPFVEMRSLDGSEYFLVPEESAPITVAESCTVERNGFPYEITADLQIIGHQVPALFMEKVENLWVGNDNKEAAIEDEELSEAGEDGEDLGLDIEKKSDERDEFYKKIDSQSFINSFVGYMLTRSSDAKIVTLKAESNFLFVEQDGKLKIKQIDLEGVMPTSNVPADSTVKHPLLCGLMGFPQVDYPLSAEGWEDYPEAGDHLQNLLLRCTSQHNEDAALEAIGRYSINSSPEEVAAKQKAYSEVIERMRSFVGSQQEGELATLKNLFFHVFPEYGKHFEELLMGGSSPQRAALIVGREPQDR